MASKEDELSQYELKGVKEIMKRDANNRAGSYGFVFEVKMRGSLCIAKKPHTIFLTDVSQEERTRVVAKFRKECILLSKLKHPNIVQFIGIYYGDRKKTDLILVMEKLSCDLVQFMAVNHEQLMLSNKLFILKDVACGLVYLHEYDPPIVHRDLTAMNVLLTDTGRAKIADVGMAKLMDERAMMASRHTRVPGQMFYMPPETHFEKAQCTPKLDIFSYGHLTLHFVLERFPEVFDIPHSEKKEGIIEQQKRKAALDTMGSDHRLYKLTISCLQDDPSKRPNSRDILDCIEGLDRNVTTLNRFRGNFLDEGPIELMHQSYKCLSKQNFDHTNYWYLISVVHIYLVNF